jgi:hypothetical protein
MLPRESVRSDRNLRDHCVENWVPTCVGSRTILARSADQVPVQAGAAPPTLRAVEVTPAEILHAAVVTSPYACVAAIDGAAG